MYPVWLVLLLFVVGVLCVNQEPIGKHPSQAKPRASLSIFNGKKTSVAKYPYIASVSQYGQEFGAAVVLNKHWLLTTAFTVGWVPIDELEFRVGSSFYDKRGQTLTASKVVTHPNYTGSWDWDIAVVKTKKPIELGEDVKPARLGTKPLRGGTRARVAGWGEYDSTEEPSEFLREAKVTIYDWKKCEAIYTSDLTKRLMCSLDENVAPCYYDFGDPLEVKGMVYGLFAGGYGCEPNENPVLYTDVPSLYKWVKSVIKSDMGDQE